MSKPLIKRSAALAGEFASLVIKDEELAQAVNGKAVCVLPAWDRELARYNLGLVRPENDNVFLLVMPSGRWSAVTPEQAEGLFAEGDEGEKALYDHACQHLYLRGKATSADLQEIDPYKEVWRQVAKGAWERHLREKREANAFKKAVEAKGGRTMVTPEQARKLSAAAVKRSDDSFVAAVQREKLALTGTWRGRRRLAKARRAIERAAKMGRRDAWVNGPEYEQAVALRDYLESQGFQVSEVLWSALGYSCGLRVRW